MADNEEDTLYDDVSAMADRIGLKGPDKQKYIHEHMTRSGYRAIPTYVRADEDEEDEEDDSGSGFFGSGKKRKRPPAEGGRRSRGSGSDDWYS